MPGIPTVPVNRLQQSFPSVDHHEKVMAGVGCVDCACVHRWCSFYVLGIAVSIFGNLTGIGRVGPWIGTLPLPL